ncbi:MAG TPA: hemerythrin domain-containing protein [Spirochaetota bacterium]|nr:hemerythrin domain-containing protein [Spirochaetota bacterium]HPJ34881.1 hemerythrin domain-containing protein [Spirochaetota bacterium]
MIYASGYLENEHDEILSLLEVLEELVARVETDRDFSVDDIAAVTGYLKFFVDEFHFRKEEDFFYPAIVEAGIVGQSGPVGMLLEEHDRLRELLDRVWSAVTGNRIEDDEFVKAAGSYITLLRAHIENENELMFPIGDEKISPSKHEKLIEEFKKFEKEISVNKEIKKLRERIDKLKA